MKRIYLLFSFLAVGTLAFAQAPKGNQFRPANDIYRNISTEKAVGTYFIDYEGVEQQIIGDIQSFVDLSVNTTDTTENEFYRAWSIVDTIQVVPEDYSTLNYIPKNNILSFMVDSVFIILGHQNNSGQMNTLRFRLTDVTTVTSGVNSYYDYSTVYWSDSIMTDSSLTGGFTGTGYPLTVVGLPVGVSVPAPYTFGLEVTYDAPQQDTLALRYSYATDGGNCPGNPAAPNIILPETYPSAYYSVKLGGGTIGNPNITFNLPRINDGAYFWFIDCDGSGGSSGDATENPYQYWSIWYKVTIADNVGLEEQSEKGVRLYNYPNPANETTTINFTLDNSANVNLYVSDISGKQVFAANLGERSSGSNSYVLNTSELSAGIYMYTLDVDGVTITRRMVVSK